MKKNLLVFFLTAFICFALIAVKSRYSIGTSSDSEFIIINWRMTPSYITDLQRPVTLTLHLKNKKNQPITDAQVTVEARHSDVAPIITAAIHDQNGFYKTSFKLTMAGDWNLLLTIKKHDGVIIKKELSFSTTTNK